MRSRTIGDTISVFVAWSLIAAAALAAIGVACGIGRAADPVYFLLPNGKVEARAAKSCDCKTCDCTPESNCGCVATPPPPPAAPGRAQNARVECVNGVCYLVSDSDPVSFAPSSAQSTNAVACATCAANSTSTQQAQNTAIQGPVRMTLSARMQKPFLERAGPVRTTLRAVGAFFGRGRAGAGGCG